ncbi:MAG: TonB-dependent receptor [Salinivirgaceae bacterium]|nr:TonB-dependent receptor [Salinivirgaceae bacterium]
MQRIAVIIGFILLTIKVLAQTDSVRNVQEVKVVSQRVAVNSTLVTAENLNQIGAQSVTDALKLLPSVQVKDYGGLGGIKSIAVRGLGAQHAAVAVDGVPAGNMQTGTVNLGVLMPQTTSSICVVNAQSCSMLQSARMLSAGFVVQLNTTDSVLKKPECDAEMRVGAFGTFMPALLLSSPINKHSSNSFALSYYHSDGDYEYTLNNGDSTKRLRRQNGNVNQLRAEWSVVGQGKAHLKAKVFGYLSDCGLPKATIFYNLNSQEKLRDAQLFGQIQSTLNFDETTACLRAKYTVAGQNYNNPQLLSNVKEFNYLQHEFFAGATVMRNVNKGVIVSASGDCTIGTLNSNRVDGKPLRVSLMGALMAKYSSRYVVVFGTLLAQQNLSQNESNVSNHSSVNPTLMLEFMPLKSVTISAFAKKIFRLPTFNDLYYNGVGNRNLKPETAEQYSISVAFDKDWRKWLIDSKVEAYYNLVSNKIVAMPTGNVFQWAMMNVGKTDIKAVDFSANLAWLPSSDLSIKIGGSYTYQLCVDVTSKKSATYNHQIAYMPRKQVSALVGVDYRSFMLTYAINYQGVRYCMNQNIATNRIEPYSDQTITFGVKQKKMTVMAEVQNVANVNYEIVKNYPMPGRAFYVKLKYIIL